MKRESFNTDDLIRILDHLVKHNQISQSFADSISHGLSVEPNETITGLVIRAFNGASDFHQ